MALCSKAFLFTGRSLRLMTNGMERLQILTANAKRTSFTANPRRPLIKYYKKKVVPEIKDFPPSQLYEDDIGKDVFESRQDDLPDFNMTNPFAKEAKYCILCKHNITPDYKNVKLLSQFVSPHTGEIYGRHITGLCRGLQSRVETEISKSRHAGLMPYYFKSVEFLRDPKLCDPLRPTRPHPY